MKPKASLYTSNIFILILFFYIFLIRGICLRYSLANNIPLQSCFKIIIKLHVGTPPNSRIRNKTTTTRKHSKKRYIRDKGKAQKTKKKATQVQPTSKRKKTQQKYYYYGKVGDYMELRCFSYVT